MQVLLLMGARLRATYGAAAAGEEKLDTFDCIGGREAQNTRPI